MPQREPLPERLHDLARKTEIRIGNHPEADLCREAASYILDLEEQVERLKFDNATTTKGAKGAHKTDKKD